MIASGMKCYGLRLWDRQVYDYEATKRNISEEINPLYVGRLRTSVCYVKVLLILQNLSCSCSVEMKHFFDYDFYLQLLHLVIIFLVKRRILLNARQHAHKNKWIHKRH